MTEAATVKPDPPENTANKPNIAAFWRRPWTRLDSYVFQEINGPFLNAMLVLNGIFFIRILAEVAELSGGKFDIPYRIVGLYFITEIPEVLHITVAMSFLLAALAAMGRMSVDSEIITPLSLGNSFWRINRPILAYGLLLSLMLSLLSHWIEPSFNRLWLREYRNFAQNLAMPNLHPGVINTFGKNAALYVDRVDQGKLADLFFVNQSDAEEQILLAERASIYTNRLLELFRAVKIDISNDPASGPTTFEANQFEQVIPAMAGMDASKTKQAITDLYETTRLWKVKANATNPTPDIDLEIALRTLSPWICMVFGLFAVPLAARHSRMRRSAGFGLSLALVGTYFIFMRLAKDAADQGRLSPWLALALPLVIFLIFGVVLQIGKNRWWSQPFRQTGDWLYHWVFGGLGALWRFIRRQRRNGRRVGGGSVRTVIFPSKLDLYVIKSFFSLYLLVQSTLLLLLLLVEFSQINRYAQKNGVETEMIWRYLFYKLPELLDTSLFLCLLIATLILFANMSRNLEVTAIQAGGGSLQRLCMPLIFCGLLATSFSYYMENTFLPSMNRTALNLRNVIRNKQDTANVRDMWLKNGEGALVNFRFYDPQEQRLMGVRQYRFRGDGQTLFERLEVPSLHFDGDWRAEKAGKSWLFSRSDGERKGILARPQAIEAGESVDLELDHEDLARRKRRASEFSIRELREYLICVESLGVSETNFRTELFAKYAQPLLPLIMMILAMPMGFRFGRRGTFFSIGVGLVSGLVFWGLFVLVKQLGASGLIHPLVAGWVVVAGFSFFSLYRFISLE